MLLAFRLRNESRRAHAGGRALRACGRMKLLGWLHGAGSASALVVGQRTRTPDPDFALGLRSPPHYFWCHVGNGIVNAPRKVPLSLRGAPPLRGGFLFLRSKFNPFRHKMKSRSSGLVGRFSDGTVRGHRSTAGDQLDLTLHEPNPWHHCSL